MLAFAMMAAIRHRANPRYTRASRCQCVATLPDECANFFAHAGYGLD
jgi:hypothetical protein